VQTSCHADVRSRQTLTTALAPRAYFSRHAEATRSEVLASLGRRRRVDRLASLVALLLFAPLASGCGDQADLRDGLNPRHRLHVDMCPDRDGLCCGSTAPERERDGGDSRQRGGLGSGSQLTVDCDTDQERRDHRPDAYRGPPPPSRCRPSWLVRRASSKPHDTQCDYRSRPLEGDQSMLRTAVVWR